MRNGSREGGANSAEECFMVDIDADSTMRESGKTAPAPRAISVRIRRLLSQVSKFIWAISIDNHSRKCVEFGGGNAWTSPAHSGSSKGACHRGAQSFGRRKQGHVKFQPGALQNASCVPRGGVPAVCSPPARFRASGSPPRCQTPQRRHDWGESTLNKMMECAFAEQELPQPLAQNIREENVR